MTAYQLDYSAIIQPIDGETDCGDQYLVKKLSNATLIAVADGLGHGKSAALAANKAMDVLRTSRQESLVSLMQECHAALQHTRGVVMILIHLSDNKISWLGVGNVLGLHWTLDNLEPQTRLLHSLPGVAGMNLPHLKVASFK